MTYNDDVKISTVILCMSACFGLSAKKMSERPERPFISLVAPAQNVDWSDCLVAFLAFYNLFMLKNKTCGEAVQGMNAAAGVDFFQAIDFSEEMKRTLKNLNLYAKK